MSSRRTTEPLDLVEAMALWKRGRRYWTSFSVNGVQLRRPLCPPGSTLATTNWQEATRLEKELIRAAMEGELAPRDPSVKLFAAIDDYLEAKKATANSERTIEFDRERFDRHRRPHPFAAWIRLFAD